MNQHTSPARVSRGTADRAGADTGYVILSYLIAGVGLYGFLGWLGDSFLHTRFLLPLGIVAGSALSLYIIVKRFGSSGQATNVEADASQGEESE